MTKVQEDILKWLDGEHDFDAGIALFKQVSRNTFYIANLQRSRRLSTLEYELNKAVRGVKREAGSGKREAGSRKSEVGSRAEGIPSGEVGSRKSEVVPKASLREKSEVRSQKSEVGSQKLKNTETKFVIRDEFPFLKRNDCPDVLKILVADMLTSHERYVKAHEQLFEVAHKSEDVCFDTAEEVVSNYLTNRQIWNELEHYKKTGKLLGEHPVFDEMRKKEAAEKMTVEEMEKKIFNLNRQLKYRQKRLKNNRKNENVAERKAEMKALKEEIRSLELKVESLKKSEQ